MNWVLEGDISLAEKKVGRASLEDMAATLHHHKKKEKESRMDGWCGGIRRTTGS
jgi:hypothetical protein